MNVAQQKAAGGWHRATAQEITQRSQSTKIARVFEELKRRSLNRFEAERIGDHALNSTVAKLRARGVLIVDEWELTPTRYGTARVKRYRFAGMSS